MDANWHFISQHMVSPQQPHVVYPDCLSCWVLGILALKLYSKMAFNSSVYLHEVICTRLKRWVPGMAQFDRHRIQATLTVLQLCHRNWMLMQANSTVHDNLAYCEYPNILMKLLKVRGSSLATEHAHFACLRAIKLCYGGNQDVFVSSSWCLNEPRTCPNKMICSKQRMYSIKVKFLRWAAIYKFAALPAGWHGHATSL